MRKIEITPGMKFGKWTVIEEVDPIYITNKPRRMFKCQCECGGVKNVQLVCLRNGHSTSCGCEHRKRASEANFKHGFTDKHPLYGVWKNMKKRCNSPYASEYENYGGRGITVCPEWSENFENFYTWAINNGWSAELSIDRIDTNGNYCPENCRWANISVQMNNTTRNHYIEYDGKTFTLSTLSKYLMIPYNIVRYRISKCKWSVNQLISNYDRNTNISR